MPAEVPLYQEVCQPIERVTRGQHVRRTTVVRLTLLVVGILAARNCTLAQVAAALDQLQLTGARKEESLERRLRRALSDPGLDPQTSYQPVLQQVLDWERLLQGSQRVVLVVDERQQGGDPLVAHQPGVRGRESAMGLAGVAAECQAAAARGGGRGGGRPGL